MLVLSNFWSKLDNLKYDDDSFMKNTIPQNFLSRIISVGFVGDSLDNSETNFPDSTSIKICDKDLS